MARQALLSEAPLQLPEPPELAPPLPPTESEPPSVPPLSSDSAVNMTRTLMLSHCKKVRSLAKKVLGSTRVRTTTEETVGAGVGGGTGGCVPPLPPPLPDASADQVSCGKGCTSPRNTYVAIEGAMGERRAHLRRRATEVVEAVGLAAGPELGREALEDLAACCMSGHASRSTFSTLDVVQPPRGHRHADGQCRDVLYRLPLPPPQEAPTWSHVGGGTGSSWRRRWRRLSRLYVSPLDVRALLAGDAGEIFLSGGTPRQRLGPGLCRIRATSAAAAAIVLCALEAPGVEQVSHAAEPAAKDTAKRPRLLQWLGRALPSS